MFAWLRRLARAGTRLGATLDRRLYSGAGRPARQLATARPSTGRISTAFRSEFPELDITDALYEMDESRMTRSGGAAAMDMMLELIAGRHGSLLAGEIADQFMTYRPRNGSDRQRMSLDQRTGIRDRRLLDHCCYGGAARGPVELRPLTASDPFKRHAAALP